MKVWRNRIFCQTLFIPYISGKFAKLYAARLIGMQFRQPLAMPNFRRLWYKLYP